MDSFINLVRAKIGSIMDLERARVDLINELHAPVRRNYSRRFVYVRNLDETFSADLVDMSAHAKVNKNFKFILTVIDNFSKFAWAEPLKSKSGKDVTAAMKRVLEKGRVCKKLHTDMGKEFYNADFQKLLKIYDIKLYSTFSPLKAPIIERFNRTLKSNMYKRFSLQGNYKWLDILPELVVTYNSTVHSTIKTAPVNVNHRNEQTIRAKIYARKKLKLNLAMAKFNIGDRVRISKSKTLFEKGYLPNWSTEIFTISRVNLTNPVTYNLKDDRGEPILGCVYQQELLKAKHSDVYLVEKVIKRKGKRMYVKWLGLDKSHNSWTQ